MNHLPQIDSPWTHARPVRPVHPYELPQLPSVQD